MASLTKRTGSDTVPFIHTPLDLSQPGIRVLRISPRPGVIQVELKHVKSTKQRYVCLSYMWGDPEPSHTTIVNGKSFSVRDNLWNFLRLARRLLIRDWLWIDACCIDQDNVLERNHQVCR
jgi:hypothetical protein